MLISETLWYKVIHLGTYPLPNLAMLMKLETVLGCVSRPSFPCLVTIKKQVVNNIFEVIKVHIILCFEAISSKKRKVVAVFIL